VKAKLLIPTQSYTQSVPHSDIVISAVGTPDNPDGSSNLTYLFAAAEEAAGHLKSSAVYVQKSTVPVGTGAKIKQLFKDKGVKAHYLSNPEFLRESTALHDSLWFDRIVVGGNDGDAAEQLMAVYRRVHDARDDIAALAGLQPPAKLPAERYITASLESAELIKVTSNAFLALKISFANSIAKLADQAGADVNEVMDVVGADTRIGRAFFDAGRGYGGGCFPKDVSGLISSATEHGVDLPIMIAATDVNESMPGYIVNKTQEKLGGLTGKRVAVLGLAFKPGTSDVRRSPGVTIANILSHSGADVTVYDPEANGEAKEDLRKSVVVCSSLEKAAQHTDAVIIATAWPEFLNYDLEKLAKAMNGNLFVDGMNAFTREGTTKASLEYIGVGR
jgi:UDPglucose 6-dehydrogenase